MPVPFKSRAEERRKIVYLALHRGKDSRRPVRGSSRPLLSSALLTSASLRCVKHPSLESPRNDARVHLISPPYARVFHHGERGEGKERRDATRKKMRRRRRRRRKEKKVSGSLTGAKESHVERRRAWHSHGTAVCTRTQLASD